MEHLYKQFQQLGKVKLNEPLLKHTTFKIGGPADLFVIIDSTESLVGALKFLEENATPYFILGGGSNMLVSDAGFRGVVIKVKAQHAQVQDDVVVADAGCITVAIAQLSIQNNLTGFEWGVGVPGTIGGALRGNAGAMGGEMKDSVSKVELFRDGEVVELDNKACEFGYRTSGIKEHGGVVLRVWLQLHKTEDKTGMKKALEHLKYRNSTQPQGYASTGCIFKNVDITPSPKGDKNKELLLKYFDESDEKIQQFLRVGKISAGWLVEQVGMKGAHKGNALVSDVHGNFILNKGGATADEVISLVEDIKTKVYTTYGIEMQEEIQIVA